LREVPFINWPSMNGVKNRFAGSSQAEKGKGIIQGKGIFQRAGNQRHIPLKGSCPDLGPYPKGGDAEKRKGNTATGESVGNLK